MEVKFTPEHKVINELFGRDVKYVIPEYQRPYSWDCVGKSDKNNQVNIMWDDLYGYFKGGDDSVYFFGSMVLVGNGHQEYQVIDGQQRLTTTLLLFVAIKCFLKNIKADVAVPELRTFVDESINLIDDMIFNKKLFGAKTLERKVKVEKNSGFDYDSVFAKVVDCEQSDSVKINDATDEQKQSANRYFKNKNYFEEQIKKEFFAGGVFKETDAQHLNNFLEFLKNRVSVVRILAPTFEIAYHIFEILNNRGLPLSNKDLLRNFIIKEFDSLKKHSKQHSAISPTEKWKNIDDRYELRDDFIGRWVESTKAAQQRYSAFNDLKEIYENDYKDKVSKKKIELFYESLEKSLDQYTKIVTVDFTDPVLKAKICFLMNAGNLRYTVNFLLTLGRQMGQMESEEAKKCVIAYECYVIYAFLVSRFAYGPVYKAIALLNQGKVDNAVKELESMVDKEEILKRLDEDIRDNETAKLLIGKLVWIQNSQTSEDVVTQEFDFNKATLEHIIPQNPDTNSDWKKNFSEEFRQKFTYKIGNMTLLTSRMNAAARNYDFKSKKIFYTKTKLPMTLSLAGMSDLSETFFLGRQKNFIDIIANDLLLEK